MSWIFPVLIAWGVLSLPGYGLMWALKTPVRLRIGWAPPVTVLVAVLLSGIFRLTGIPWQPLTVAAALVLAIGGIILCHRGLTMARATGRHSSARSRRKDSRREPARSPTASILVTGIAVLCGLLVVASASVRMGGINTLQGGYDAFFHHASIAFIRDDGDAFLTTALADIYGEPTFYPVVFSSLAALLPFDTVTSANAMVLAVLAAIPSSVAAMLATVLGPRRAAPAAVAAGAAASTVFLSTPAMGLVMGLWPNVLGALCLPVAIASVFRLIDDSRAPVAGPAVLGHLAVLMGATLAHPAMFFSVAVVGVLVLLVRGLIRIVRGDLPRRGLLLVTGALAAAVAIVAGSAAFLSGMDLTTPSGEALSEVLVQILVDSPRISVIGAPLWPVAAVWALALVGVLASLRRGESIGITAGIGVIATVALGLATQLEHPVAGALVNPWYGARERIAPLMMCLLLIVMARGVLAVTSASRERRSLAAAGPVSLVVLVTTVVLALVVPHRLPLMGSLAYTAYGVHLAPYVTPEERTFIERSAAELPPDAVVLADPRDGAPLYWFVGGVETVYPTMSSPQSRDGQLIGAYITHPDDQGLVCDALDRVGPTHLYRDTSEFSGRSLNAEASEPWSGIHDIPNSMLTLVDRDGPYALYELEAPC